METKKENMLLSRAWQTEPATMQKPANRKLMLISRRAGTPMASIAAEGRNMPSSVSGISWNSTKPSIVKKDA